MERRLRVNIIWSNIELRVSVSLEFIINLEKFFRLILDLSAQDKRTLHLR